MAINNSDPRDAIDWGTRVPGGNTITVFFAPKGAVISDGWDYYTADGWTAYEIQQFQTAFTLIESVVNVDFVRVWTRSAADFVIGIDANREMDSGTLGWMMPPGEPSAGNALFNGLEWDRTAGGDLSVGGYSFVTIVHELLHGLGLAHPFDYGGTSNVFLDINGNPIGTYDLGPALLNQGVFTTMSYNSGFYAGPTGTSAYYQDFWDFGYEIGPSALDIAVLQQKYGANTSFRAGDTTYTLPDANKIGTGYRAIWDTGGEDTIQYLGTRDTTINLLMATLDYERGGGGFISGAAGVAGGFTIAAGVIIENARSGGGNDRLVGNASANDLLAGAGSDTLFGLYGNDVLVGGLGNDIAYGGADSDRLLGFGGRDELFGGTGADSIFGGLGNDKLLGEDGDDTLFGAGGNDRLAGGDGNDVLGGGFGNDLVWGGIGNDVIYGSPGDDIVSGGTGADTFEFAAGTGYDRVHDFDVTEDKLVFDPALWGGEARTAAEIAAQAKVIDLGVVWYFGGGNRVLLLGLTDTDGLDGAILV